MGASIKNAGAISTVTDMVILSELYKQHSIMSIHYKQQISYVQIQRIKNRFIKCKYIIPNRLHKTHIFTFTDKGKNIVKIINKLFNEISD